MFKKLLVVSVFVCLIASQSFGQYYVGSKAAGMGGCGVSSMPGLQGIYYNPALLMAGGVGGFNSSIGSSYTNFDKLLGTVSGMTNIASFLTDNFNNELSFSSTFFGDFGFNVNKVGISLLPYGTVSLSKNAGELQATFNGNFTYAGILTLGHTYSVGFLPASLHLGTNIKYMGATNGGMTADPTATTSNFDFSTGSGMGLDVGALTTFKVPFVTELAVGFAARNITGSLSYDDKRIPYTFDNITGEITQGAEQTIATGRSAALTPNYLLGASGTVPGVGLLLAMDIETENSNTTTHLGLEYPFLMGALVARAGVASGNNVSLTTLGAKFGLPFIGMDFAYVINNNDSTNNMLVFDFSAGI